MKIDLDDECADHARFLPADWALLGAVETDDGERGALVRTRANVYVQVNGMLVRALDQAQVRELLAQACAAPPTRTGSASADNQA